MAILLNLYSVLFAMNDRYMQALLARSVARARMLDIVTQSSIDIFGTSDSSPGIGKARTRAIPLFLGSLFVRIVNGTGTRCQGSVVSLLISRVLLIVIGRLIPEHCRATPR